MCNLHYNNYKKDLHILPLLVSDMVGFSLDFEIFNSG